MPSPRPAPCRITSEPLSSSLPATIHSWPATSAFYSHSWISLLPILPPLPLHRACNSLHISLSLQTSVFSKLFTRVRSKKSSIIHYFILNPYFLSPLEPSQTCALTRFTPLPRCLFPWCPWLWKYLPLARWTLLPSNTHQKHQFPWKPTSPPSQPPSEALVELWLPSNGDSQSQSQMPFASPPVR